MRRFALRLTAFAAVVLLQACGGGGGGSAVAPPGGGNGGPGGLPASVVVSSGAITGADDTFSPADGDAAAGGNGQTVDGIPCLPSMDESHYHIHVFLGFVDNGALRALPDGTGMKNPGSDVAGVVSTASCFYYLHTHDAAGVIHIESPSTASRTATLYTLGQYLDIWGQSLAGARIVTSGQRYQGQGDQTVSNSTYTQYSGNPRAIPLYAHEVIWVEYGPAFPAQLPSVHFGY